MKLLTILLINLVTLGYSFACEENKPLLDYPSDYKVAYIVPTEPIEEVTLYTQPQLACIGGVVKQFAEITTPNDIIIAPGRSLIHFMEGVKILGEQDPKFNRKVFTPAFSKGAFLSTTYSEELKEYLEKECPQIIKDQITDEKIEQMNEEVSKIFPPSPLDEDQYSEICHKIVNSLENNIGIIFDFKSKKFIHAYEWQPTAECVNNYSEYLTTIVGITPSILKECEGNVIITDTMYSGEGLKEFISLILRLGEFANSDIAKKIKVINVKHKVFRDKKEFFKDYPVSNILIEQEESLDFSYNYLEDPSFFCPPWSWTEKALFKHAPSLTSLRRMEELRKYLKLVGSNGMV